MGTAGTMTGMSLYLKKVKLSVTGVGILTAPGDHVPGPQMLNLLLPIKFPWEKAINSIEVRSPKLFEKSLQLCHNSLLVGPSSRLALVGLLNFIKKWKEAGMLDSLRNESGKIPCVFICCDQPFQYISEYFIKLSPEYFIPITNEELWHVDLYWYNIDWELSLEQAYQILVSSKSQGRVLVQSITVIDLCNKVDFNQYHIVDSLNLDIDAKP